MLATCNNYNGDISVQQTGFKRITQDPLPPFGHNISMYLLCFDRPNLLSNNSTETCTWEPLLQTIASCELNYKFHHSMGFPLVSPVKSIYAW